MPRPEPRQLAQFQFPLRYLFIFTFVVAIFSWLVTILDPEWWILLLLPTLPIVGSSASILGAIYFRGRRRAFCIGFITGLAHVVVMAFFAGIPWGRYPREWEVLILAPFFLLLVPAITGWVGDYFYRLSHPPENAATSAAVAGASSPPPSSRGGEGVPATRLELPDP